MDGEGIWQLGISMARQMQREDGTGTMYLFTNVHAAIYHGLEMLVDAQWYPMKPHVMIPVGGDPTFIYGLDSQLPPYRVEVLK